MHVCIMRIRLLMFIVRVHDTTQRDVCQYVCVTIALRHVTHVTHVTRHNVCVCVCVCVCVMTTQHNTQRYVTSHITLHNAHVEENKMQMHMQMHIQIYNIYSSVNVYMRKPGGVAEAKQWGLSRSCSLAAR